jgi:DNA-binding MarR family transcriptional regulator
MAKVFTEEDIIHVQESPVRVKILGHLLSISDSISVSALSKAINEKSSNVNYHCDELAKPAHGLVEKFITKRKYVKITEKGRVVWREVDRRNKALVVNESHARRIDKRES